MIEIKNVTKQYGSKAALKNVSIEFNNGIIGLLGPNGAGKSTLMRIMSTVDIPTNGTVTYKGEDIIKTPKLLRRELGYLPQDFGVYPNMTASEFLEYMAAMKSMQRELHGNAFQN
jgi:ABC-type multidrug transport system ATPase subunit